MPPEESTKESTSLLVPQKDNITNLAEKKPNTLLRSRYLQFLETPEDYSDLSFSPTEAQFIRRKLSHLSTGAFAAIPLICPGEDGCPFADTCPFVQVGQTPTNRPCLVETNLLKEWTISFIYEYDVHPESLTDRIAVQELAEIELLLYRINSNLAKVRYGELIAESVSNVTPQGHIVYEEKVVPLMDLKLRLQARRDRVVKSLVGDRENKYKRQAALKQVDGKGDASNQGADLRAQLEKLHRQLSGVSAKLAEKDGTALILEEVNIRKSEDIEKVTVKMSEHEKRLTKEREEQEQIREEKEKEEQITPEDYMASLLDGEEPWD